MNDIKDQEWVIDEDELALENSIFKKHEGEYKSRKIVEQKEKVIFPSQQKPHLMNSPKAVPSLMVEKMTITLFLTLFPYLLGMVLFFIIIPLLFGVDFSVLFLATDFIDWLTHFIFWSIGYIILTFTGISFILSRR